MADKTERIILQVELDIDQLKKDAVDYRTKLSQLKAEQKETNQQLKELEAAGQRGGASWQNLTEKASQNSIAIKKTNVALAETEKIIRLNTEAVEAADGSNEQLRAQLAILTKQYNELSAAQRDNSEEGKKLSGQIKTISDELKKNESAIGDNRRNVGNYEEAIKKAFNQLPSVTSKLNQINASINNLNKRFQEGAVNEKQFNKEQAELNTLLTQTAGELATLNKNMEDASKNVLAVSDGFKPLRQRLKEAKDEATLLQDQFEAGLIPEEAVIKAEKKVADLSERMDDFQKRIQALNPEAKFAAFTQAASSVAGGLSAVVGTMGLLGVESDETQKLLLKVQSALAISTGLQQLAQLGDSLKNIRIILGLTNTATKAQTTAQAAATIQTEAGAVANTQLAASSVGAAAGAKATGVALNSMLGPLGLVLILTTTLVSALDAIGSSGKKGVEELTNELEEEAAAYKVLLDEIKVKNDAQINEAETALNLAKQRKESADVIAGLEKNLNAAKKQALSDELDQNEDHLKNLEEAHRKSVEVQFSKLTKDEREAEIKRNQGILNEISSIQTKNKQILIEQQKLQSGLISIDEDANDQRKQEENKIQDLRIANITDDFEKEIAAIREAARQKIAAIKDTEANVEEQRKLIAEDALKKITQATLQNELSVIQERNKLSIALTREGSQERILAEIKALQLEGEAQLRLITGNGKLAQQKRLTLQAETNEKLAQKEKEFLDRIRDIQSENAQLTSELVDQQSEFFLQKRFEQLAIQERKEIDEAIKKGTDVALVEQKFHDLRLKEEQDFNDTKLKFQQDINDKLFQASQVNAPQSSLFNIDARIQQEQKLFERELDEIDKQQNRKEEKAKRDFDLQFAEAGDNADKQIQAFKDYQDTLGRINDESLASRELATQIHYANVIDITVSSIQKILDTAQGAFEAFSTIINNILESEQNQEAERLANLEEVGDERKRILQSQIDQIDADNAQALTEDQRRRKKAADEIKKIDEDLARERVNSEKKMAEEKKELQKQAAIIDFILGTGKVIVSTAEAIAKSVAASPLTFGQPFAGFALASGIIQEAVIASQLVKITSLKEGGAIAWSTDGGYTGTGDPSSVSTAVGDKPYEYHFSEYVIPDPVLKVPAVKGFVDNVLEPMRKNYSMPVPVFGRPSFQVGGAAEIVASQNIINNIPGLTPGDIEGAMLNAISQLKIFTAIEDINAGQDQAATIKNRAIVLGG